MYHAVAAPPSLLAIDPESFLIQMKWLFDNGYKTLSSKDLPQYFAYPESFPKKSVLLTFDDGYECLYANAWPVLWRFGFSATIFLVTGRIGKDNDWDNQSISYSKLPLLGWSKIHEMDRAGIDFGSHTISHPRLDLLDRKALEIEIAESKIYLEQELGHSVDTFAYPFGWYNDTVLSMVREHYQTAFSTHLGLVSKKSRRHELERIEIYYLRQPEMFPIIAKSYFQAYIGFRRIFRQIGSRVLGRGWR